jgi:nucleoside-diphosphate-sugar epimerase
VGDITKSKRELGWQPSRDLATQIDDTLRWRRKMSR